MEIGAMLLNSSQKVIASSEIELYNSDGYIIAGGSAQALVAVVSTIGEEMSDLALDGKTDNRRVDFIVSTEDLPELPEDGYYIMFNDVRYNCYQKEGQYSAGSYSDQFKQRFRIHTRRQGK